MCRAKEQTPKKINRKPFEVKMLTVETCLYHFFDAHRIQLCVLPLLYGHILCTTLKTSTEEQTASIQINHIEWCTVAVEQQDRIPSYLLRGAQKYIASTQHPCREWVFYLWKTFRTIETMRCAHFWNYTQKLEIFSSETPSTSTAGHGVLLHRIPLLISSLQTPEILSEASHR